MDDIDFNRSDEQIMLVESASQFLADKLPLERVREIMESETGFDQAIWDETAAQGWQAMHIPERYGGAGFSVGETFLLIEEMGRSLAPLPFLGSAILATSAILEAGSEVQKSRFLPGLADGTTKAALAVLESAGSWSPATIHGTAAFDGDAWSISAEKPYVIDGTAADFFVVAAKHDDQVSLFVVPADQAVVTPRVSLDSTRRIASVSFNRAQVPADSLLGPPGSGWSTVERVRAIGSVAIAYEAVGGAQAVLDMSVAYAKERVQFGRKIGSFQAVKHMCADNLVALESAKSLTYYAGWAAAHDSGELALMAPSAKSYATSTYFKAAGDNIQILGGIGFTWEHDAHLFFKRATSLEVMLGTGSEQRTLLAERLDV
ncbi:MAG: acyl-CoA/acyl-ACP dehydrogenase [Acidimicrobiia bacterium]|nr:acyl-CoA/acyl-ACP dehydrogenase [Acidimicrobiia bacterium]MBT8248922.1 acyl-CoA/acyl-ACP dehydrogenase [Acidimicrobiia bacterium]NNC43511.1 acyl-CoA/acyl-ACP dehydrogenase [Acidimicrobiia bacterium]NND13175.1 acyl-CoA/acyl-ACP dehydrogenase [Acidimicrobiia bacterium]NNL27096.1 acyl-CoA/acyl-ACP dehydrogenase [Acidimicrobiia bacterium]